MFLRFQEWLSVFGEQWGGWWFVWNVSSTRQLIKTQAQVSVYCTNKRNQKFRAFFESPSKKSESDYKNFIILI
jgi:hypothetical protein